MNYHQRRWLNRAESAEWWMVSRNANGNVVIFGIWEYAVAETKLNEERSVQTPCLLHSEVSERKQLSGSFMSTVY